VKLPVPEPGLVIRYSYLWASEAQLRREEGVKDRPCAIVLVVRNEADDLIVRVLPVTHSPPNDPQEALEMPAATKARLGLNAERSWVVLTESNEFAWPGPDLRPAVPGDAGSVAFGFLPPRFFRALRDRLVELHRQRRHARVSRTE